MDLLGLDGVFLGGVALIMDLLLAVRSVVIEVDLAVPPLENAVPETTCHGAQPWSRRPARGRP